MVKTVDPCNPSASRAIGLIATENTTSSLTIVLTKNSDWFWPLQKAASLSSEWTTAHLGGSIDANGRDYVNPIMMTSQYINISQRESLRVV